MVMWRRDASPWSRTQTPCHCYGHENSKCTTTRSFLHQTIDHVREYVRGTVHTNGIENFWSLLKRSIKGTYVKVAPFHLQRYATEQGYRFNFRKTDDAGRFWQLLTQVVGKRLTYRQLAAVGDCGFMGLQ